MGPHLRTQRSPSEQKPEAAAPGLVLPDPQPRAPFRFPFRPKGAQGGGLGGGPHAKGAWLRRNGTVFIHPGGASRRPWGPGIRLSPSGYGQALSCLLLSFRHLLLQSLEGFPGPGVRSPRASVVGGFGPSRPSCDDSRPSPGLPFLQGLRGSEPGRKVPRGLGDRRGHGVPGSTEQSLRGCFLSRLARGTRAKRAEDRHARFWGFLRSTCILSPWFCRSRAHGPSSS